jgi:3-oxoadipate enol-lactonase
VLLGMSQGARLALHFAHRVPERVRALVLDGAPAVDAEPELPLARFRRRLESGGVEALRTDILAHALMQPHGAGGRCELLHRLLARYQGLDLLHPVRRASPPDLGAITVPALILNGRHDSAARIAAGHTLCASIRDARRIELPSAGHLALLDDPAGYVAAVSAFCDGLPA